MKDDGVARRRKAPLEKGSKPSTEALKQIHQRLREVGVDLKPAKGAPKK